MSDEQPADRPERPPSPRPGRLAEHRGLLGVVFVLALVAGAIFLIERLTYYAALGDCAFTHAPQCRQLIGR